MKKHCCLLQPQVLLGHLPFPHFSWSQPPMLNMHLGILLEPHDEKSASGNYFTAATPVKLKTAITNNCKRGFYVLNCIISTLWRRFYWRLTSVGSVNSASVHKLQGSKKSWNACVIILGRGEESGGVIKKGKKGRHFVKNLPRKIKMVPFLHPLSHFAEPYLQHFSCIYLNVHSTDIKSLKIPFCNKH